MIFQDVGVALRVDQDSPVGVAQGWVPGIEHIHCAPVVKGGPGGAVTERVGAQSAGRVERAAHSRPGFAAPVLGLVLKVDSRLFP